MTRVRALIAGAVFLLTGAYALAADVSVLTGDVNLTVSTATAGAQPDPATDETGQIQWTTLALDPVKKITVQTDVASPQFALSVRATNISAADGTAAGDVVLSTSAADFVTGIPAGVPPEEPGTCNLRYTATATAAQGTGSDVHTITFTITDQ